MIRIWVALAALAAGAALLAGCGGDGGDTLSQEEFEAEVGAIGDTLAATFQRIAGEASALSAEQPASEEELRDVSSRLAVVVGDGADELNGAADQLDSLSPPEDAREATGQLVEGLRGLAADVEALELALAEGDFASVLELVGRLQELGGSESLGQIETAVAELRELGYEIQGTG